MDNKNNQNDFSQTGNNPQYPEYQSWQQPTEQYQNHSQYQGQQSAYGNTGAYHGQQYTQAPPAYYPAPKPRRLFRNAIKTILTTVMLVRSVLVLILLFMLVGLIGLMSAEPSLDVAPIGPHFSVIRVEGTIMGPTGGFMASGGYNHTLTMRYIRNLMNNPNDRGILLYLNTPGGTIYHSDELYLLLLEYKEQTGRPVYAYMSSTCASGGVYVAMAADHIIANRMTMTGSIGVVFNLGFDASELFYDIGLRTVIVNSGEHKSTGALGTEITPRQIAIFQDMVEEGNDLFVSIVADGRGMSEQAVREFADGRIFSAQQALELGLVDELGTWQGALELFRERTNAAAFHPDLTTPLTFWESMLIRIPILNHIDPIDMAVSRFVDLPTGIPLAIAPELVN